MSFLKRFVQHPQTVFLVDVLQYVLKNDMFRLEDQIYNQLHGIAMGTKLAPALATVYIGDLEETFVESRRPKLDLLKRYSDDIFILWSHPLEEFDRFLENLNKKEKRIRFTAEVN